MYRKLEVSQKQAASKLFQQTSLLVVAGIGYQYVHGSLWDVIVLTGLAIGFGFYSVDILSGVKDNLTNGGEK